MGRAAAPSLTTRTPDTKKPGVVNGRAFFYMPLIKSERLALVFKVIQSFK